MAPAFATAHPMQLPGRLARTTVGDLLGRLYRAAATGVLELKVGTRHHRIHLHRGFVLAVDLDVTLPPARLGEVLVGEGFAPLDAVARALSRQQMLGDDSLPHGEILVRAGVLSAEVRDAALRRQSRARLDALFKLLDGRDAEVRFLIGVSASSIAKRRTQKIPPSPLLPREFLHGRPRARDSSPPDAAPKSAPPRELDRSAPIERLRALRLLGLPPGADDASIRRAFRAAAARVHPDRHQALPECERDRLQRALAELSAAYHLLCA